MDEQSRPRISSGVPGLDDVVGGGFLASRLHLLKGAPGTGKTVLANQIGFHHARAGGRVLYGTLLAEMHGTLLDNLRSFAFFEPSVVGQQVQYLSFTAALQERGLDGIMRDLGTVVRRDRPSVLVLDGFLPIDPMIGSSLRVAMFMQDLEALSSLLGMNVLLTDSTPARTQVPMHTLADGIIELEESLLGRRTRRALRVCKMRGTRHLEGLHPFHIDREGCHVSPRVPAARESARGD
jgi:circadian clock protein KaiC